MSARRVCAACGRVHGSDAVVAIGRFLSFGPTGYIARKVDDAPIRATREEAMVDACVAMAKGGTP